MRTPPTVRLANEIAVQFRHRPHDTAALEIASHIRSFWDPRMRRELLHHATTAPETLDPLAVAAARLVAAM